MHAATIVIQLYHMHAATIVIQLYRMHAATIVTYAVLDGGRTGLLVRCCFHWHPTEYGHPPRSPTSDDLIALSHVARNHIDDIR